MRVAVGVVTCERPGLLRRTLTSLGEGDFTLDVVDNGPRGSKLPAAGFARAAALALATGADIVMLSPDDIEYQADWLDVLRRFWARAPQAIALAGHCFLPVWHWSVPFGGLEVGGVKALLRPCTIDAWSYRRADAELCRVEVAPAGWEKAICRRVMDAGRLLCEIGIAQHVGAGQSLMGHDATWRAGQPVEPYLERWL